MMFVTKIFKNSIRFPTIVNQILINLPHTKDIQDKANNKNVRVYPIAAW